MRITFLIIKDLLFNHNIIFFKNKSIMLVLVVIKTSFIT